MQQVDLYIWKFEQHLKILNFILHNCVPFIWKRGHFEDNECCCSLIFLSCYSSWDYTLLYWQCLISPHKNDVPCDCLFLKFLLKEMSLEPSVRNWRIQKISKSWMKIIYIFQLETKISRVSWETQFTVHLPLRDVCLQNQICQQYTSRTLLKLIPSTLKT